MRYEIVIPSTADGALAVTIANWLNKIGDQLTEGSDLVEATTEKITLYVTAPANGVLAEITCPEGSMVDVGTVIGYVEGA